jgi:hypothetical protein
MQVLARSDRDRGRYKWGVLVLTSHGEDAAGLTKSSKRLCATWSRKNDPDKQPPHLERTLMPKYVIEREIPNIG